MYSCISRNLYSICCRIKDYVVWIVGIMCLFVRDFSTITIIINIAFFTVYFYLYLCITNETFEKYVTVLETPIFLWKWFYFLHKIKTFFLHEICILFFNFFYFVSVLTSLFCSSSRTDGTLSLPPCGRNLYLLIWISVFIIALHLIRPFLQPERVLSNIKSWHILSQDKTLNPLYKFVKFFRKNQLLIFTFEHGESEHVIAIHVLLSNKGNQLLIVPFFAGL